MKTRVAPRRSLPAAALLLAAGLLCGCVSSPKATCNDVSIDICEALNECGRLGPNFTSTDQCVASFNGLWEVGNQDDAGCRTEWDLVADLSCDQLTSFYQL